MIYVIAIFRSRNQTISYSQILKSYGIRCDTITTPREVMIACGISVRFEPQNITEARSILSRRKFDSFVGFYKVLERGSSRIVSPV